MINETDIILDTGQGEAKLLEALVAKQENPLTQDGYIGAFCRTYTVTEALDKFCVGIYKRTARPECYHYIGDSDCSDVFVYDNNLFAYSLNASDNNSYVLMNAFDLVRRVRFGNNERLSMNAMMRLCREDVDVVICYEKEKEKVKRRRCVDRLAKELGTEACREWLEYLEYNDRQELMVTVHNMVVILENDKKLQHIVYNEQCDCLAIKGDVPWPRVSEDFSDADYAGLQHYFSKTYHMECGNKLEVAVTTVAARRKFNPIKDYLENLPPWDGVPRVDTLLVDYLGAELSEYTKMVTRLTFLAAISRIYEPGTHFDSMLILNGPQWLGKSTLLHKLGKAWYSDSLDLDDMRDIKRSSEKLARSWIVEIPELAGLNKTDWKKIKAFLSRDNDDYRDSYAKRATSHPRRCVMVATCNDKTGLLGDVTGNRRFWPVRVYGNAQKTPYDLTSEMVDKLWAEAYALYKEGNFELYLQDDVRETAEQIQESNLEIDGRLGLLEKYLDMPVPHEWYDLTVDERLAYIRRYETHGESVDDGVPRRYICNLEILEEFFHRNTKDDNKEETKTIRKMMACLQNWQWVGDERHFIKPYRQQRCYQRI